MTTINFHQVITGDAISNFARNIYYKGKLTDIGVKYPKSKRHQKARYVLNGLRPRLSKEQQDKILNGEAMLKGQSVCSDPSCHQCVGHEPIHFVDEIDYNFKVDLAEFRLEQVIDKLEQDGMREYYAPTEQEIESLKQEKIKQKQKERQKKELEKMLSSDSKEKVQLGDYYIRLKLLEEYAKAIAWCERSGMFSIGRNDPMISFNALNNRIEKHRAIFKECGVVYHGEQPSIEKHPESRKLYDLIEEWLMKNYPSLAKDNRLKNKSNDKKGGMK